jgi:hypothetical protein
MLSGFVKVGMYAFVFAAVGTVGQAFGFGADSSPGATSAAADRVTTVLNHVPGSSRVGGVGIPGAEQASFRNAGNMMR